MNQPYLREIFRCLFHLFLYENVCCGYSFEASLWGFDKQICDLKIVIIFLPIIFNMCFGCSIEPSHWDGSFEYPQHMFDWEISCFDWLRNKKTSFFVPSLNYRPGSLYDASNEYPQLFLRNRKEVSSFFLSKKRRLLSEAMINFHPHISIILLLMLKWSQICVTLWDAMKAYT